MTEDAAVQFIAARITRPPSPANEIEVAVAKVYQQTTFNSTPRKYPNAPRPVSLAEIKYDEARLRATAAKITMPANWRHWLWERSPMRPETQNALSFLSRLYQPGEIVQTFDVFKTKNPRWTVTVTNPMDCRVPDAMRDGGDFQSGIWFLCNPVDGLWHPNPRRNNEPSCRSEESLTAFRYIVLESDVAPAHLWLAFVAQIPTKIAAITPEQIVEHNLPTRPMKKNDKRGKEWIGGCVEVDTMPPAVLKGIVRDCITQHIDPYQWQQTKLIEAEERETLRQYAETWRAA